ncbi:MAG: hypothetical protein GY722_14175 [bacterium]|nr:hypothetical protein [bacterium]
MHSFHSQEVSLEDPFVMEIGGLIASGELETAIGRLEGARFYSRGEVMRIRFFLALQLFLANAAVGQLPYFLDTGEFQVNTYTTDSQRGGEVSHGPDGSFVVIWSSRIQDGSSGDSVMAQRYDSNGDPSDGEFQVNTYTTGYQWNPAVSHASNGDFAVVWDSRPMSFVHRSVRGQLFDSAGDPLGGEFLAEEIVDSQELPDVSHGPDGTFVVVWDTDNQDPSSTGVRGRRFDPLGVPVGDAFLINTYTTSKQGISTIDHSSDGSYAVAWVSFDQDGSGASVQGQRFDPLGQPQGEEFQVNETTVSSQYGPGISFGPDGGFVVAWHSWGQDGDGWSVQGRRYDSSGDPITGEFQVNTFTTGSQYFAGVSHGPDGSFVVAWMSYEQDGSSSSVQARRYDRHGDSAGGEFQVNTYTTAYQKLPHLSHGPDGSFVVAWVSWMQDGSGTGVFAKRYVSLQIFADGFESGDTLAWSQ